MKIALEELRHRQSLPLNDKIAMTQHVIEEWWKHWGGKVYLAFSGGKDSSVLRHIIDNSLVRGIPSVFADTGLEYPELKQHIVSFGDVVVVRPSLSYRQVIDKYGYPVVSKKVSRFLWDVRHSSPKNAKTVNLRMTGYNSSGKYSPTMMLPLKWRFLIDAPFNISDKCCLALKKSPLTTYRRKTGRHPYTAMMASDSQLREQSYLENGCSLYDAKEPICNPMGFWTDQDVLEYASLFRISLPSVYGDIIGIPGNLRTTGVKRTGCIWCMFGAHLESRPNRFEQLHVTHPQIYDYCINQLGLGEVMDYIGIEY